MVFNNDENMSRRTAQTRVEHAMDTDEKDRESDSSGDQAKARLIVKYNGEDHDITRFGKFHPGGARTLQRFAGRDVSETLERTHHSPAALKLVPEYRVKDEQQVSPTNADDWDRDLIDWSQPLLYQVGSLADNYQAWLLAPVDRNLRLFRSDLMESLTVVSPRTAIFVWPPLLVAMTAVAYYQALWLQYSSLSASYSVALGWCAGLLLWPLVEYSIHRWLFHACPPPTSPLLITLHFGIHGLHHKSPFDTRRLLFPPAPALTLAAFAYLPLRAVLAAPLATAVLAGALTGFLGYDLTHYYLHTGSPSPGTRLYRLKRRHNQHHFAQFDRGYGISSSFWDHVFKTGITLKDIKFELRW
ncbi:hypothetical protein LSTR_LSTR010423 [Laodelphax striatellus]|uniref:Fatty acid 2-hydroxylase n=1 Tax=Laodelphax striatellus TaxID=195883 RepID=A0A482XHF3_LAOST|nr:hypothetical protein LSTR_LSTR010423 [Laodelphax striatellus]